MTREEYNENVEEILKHIEKVLIKKNVEYGAVKRPLHNFHEGAKVLRETPEKVLLGYATKHWVSVVDMVKSESVDLAKFAEKTTDLINYMILLNLLVMERIDAES